MKVTIFQAGKHLLVGAVATLFDLAIFTLLAIVMNSVAGKAISFLCSTMIKYWGNKHWAFAAHGYEAWHMEILKFTFITIVGLLLDVTAFWYFTKFFHASISVVLAAGVVAAWNFTGYKFLVFKK